MSDEFRMLRPVVDNKLARPLGLEGKADILGRCLPFVTLGPAAVNSNCEK